MKRTVSKRAHPLLPLLAALAGATVTEVSLMAAAPAIFVSSLADADVHLLRSTDSDYSHGWADGEPAIGFAPVLPFTVAIQNKSSREVIAYYVTWECTATDGRVLKHTRDVFNFEKLQPGSRLTPGGIELVALNVAVEAGRWDDSLSESVLRLAMMFNSQSMIHISLDAVLFRDGTTAGPNTSHAVERWAAVLEGQAEVIDHATSTVVSALRPSLLRRAEIGVDLYRRQLQTGDQPDSGAVAIFLSRSMEVEAFPSLARAYYALRAVEVIDQSGTENFLGQVKLAQLDKENFVSVKGLRK